MGLELAQAFVRLRVDPAGIKKDVDKGLASADATKAGERTGSQYASGFEKQSSAKIKKATTAVATGASLALVGIGVASLKMAGDYQKGLTQLVTSAGEMQKNLAVVDAGVKKIAVSTGTSTTQLVAGLYTIESAGYHGAKGLEVLRAAAQGARAENASLATVSDALTTVMNDYHLSTDKATSVTSALVSTVAHGKTHLEDLASALSRVLPTAAALHVSFPQIASDMAVLTSHGVSARLAAQGLNSTLIALASPSQKAAKAMVSVGLSAGKVQDDLGKHGLTFVVNELSDAFFNHAGPAGKLMLATLNGLPPAIQTAAHQFLAGTITTKGWAAATKNLTVGQKAQVAQFVKTASSATGLKQNYVSALTAMVGGQRGLAVALNLTGQNAKTAKSDVTAISEAYVHGSKNVEGWSAVQQTFNFRLSQLREEAQTTGITLGERLLPAVTHVVTFIGGHESAVITFGEALAGLAITVGVVSLAAKGFTIGKTIAGGLTDATRAVKTFGTEAIAAADTQKVLDAASAGGIGRLAAAQLQLAQAAEGTAAAETTFAVGAQGATVAVGELTLAEKASAVAGALLANPFVWVAGAALGIGALAYVTHGFSATVYGSATALAKQNDAVGFNVAGYQRLANATSGLEGNLGRLDQVLHTTGGGMTVARGDSIALRPAIQVLGQVHTYAAQAAGLLGSRLVMLQGAYGLTSSGAQRLAAASGISAQHLAATGPAGDAAYNALSRYAAGLSAAKLREYQAATASDHFNTSLRTINGTLLAAQGDLLGWRQAQVSATQAIAASTTGLHGNSAAALEAKQAVLGSTQAAIQFAQSQNNSASGVRKATGVIQQQITWLKQHAAHSRFAAQEVDALRAALARIKSEHASIVVSASGTWHITAGGSVPGGGTKHIVAARGAYISTGRPGVDDQLALVQRKELIVPANIVDSGAVDHLRGMIPGFAAGGVVGNYSGNPKGTGAFLVRMDAATLTALANATGKATSDGIKKAQAAASASGGFGVAGPGGGAPGANAALARKMFPEVDWPSWNYVEMREAGWNQFARNPSSGAYGIPQALPPSKMGPAANPPQSNPAAQISWMVSYMNSRYGGSPGAAAHERAFNWYGAGTGKGGAAPGWSWVGEQGRELMYSPHGGQTILPHGLSMAVTRGYATGTPDIGKPHKPKKPVGGGGKQTRAQKYAAELRHDQNLLALRRTEAAKEITRLRVPLERDELYLLQHPGLSASAKKTVQARIAREEKFVSAYRDKQDALESGLEKEIKLLQALIAAGPKPKGPPVGKPPPVHLGTKKQELAELAAYVTKLNALEKTTTAHLKPMRRKLEGEELQLLTANLSPSQKAGLRLEIKRQEAAISKYRKGQTKKEGDLSDVITLLRDLTGEPTGTKYGGGAAPPPDDGSGDGGAGGDGGSGGTAPVQALPTPGWLGAAGGAGGFGPGGTDSPGGSAGGGIPGLGGSLGGGSAPFPGLPSPGVAMGGGYGTWSGGTSGGDGAASQEMLRVLGAKFDMLTNVTRAVPAGVAQGLDGVGRTARQRAYYRPR